MDTYYGAKPIYIDMQYVGKDKEKESALSEKLQDILEVDVVIGIFSNFFRKKLIM